MGKSEVLFYGSLVVLIVIFFVGGLVVGVLTIVAMVMTGMYMFDLTTESWEKVQRERGL